MGLIVDVVPNHMGVGGSENALVDRHPRMGPARGARAFLRCRLALARSRAARQSARAVSRRGVRRGIAGRQDQARVRRRRRPLHDRVLLAHVSRVPGRLSVDPAGSARTRATLRRPDDATHRPRRAPTKRARHCATLAATEGSRAAIEATLAAHSADSPQGRDRLHRLLERQHFRLAWWRTAADEVNWRRFFDVSTLGGVRVERPEVFEASHALIFRLFTEGLIDGVRIDHVDGLAEPREYCQRLRQRLDELAPQRPQALQDGPHVFHRREDSGARRAVAQRLASGRHDRLRLHERRRRALARSPRRRDRWRKRGPRCPGAAPISPTKRSSRDARFWRRTCRRNWIA